MLHTCDCFLVFFDESNSIFRLRNMELARKNKSKAKKRRRWQRRRTIAWMQQQLSPTMPWAPLSSSVSFTWTSLHSCGHFEHLFGHWHEDLFQSLEPRPRSIYDVLDSSPARRENDQDKAKPMKKEPPKKVSELWVSFQNNVVSK